MIRLVPSFTLLMLSAVSDVGPAQFSTSWGELGSAEGVQYEVSPVTVLESPEESDERQRRRDNHTPRGVATRLATQIEYSTLRDAHGGVDEPALCMATVGLATIRGPPRA